MVRNCKRMLISEFIFLCPIKSTTVVKKFPPENRCKHIPKLKTGTTFQDEATFPLMSREPTEPTQDLSITLGFTHNQRFKFFFRALCYKNNQLSIVFLSTWSTRTVFLESLKRLRGSVFCHQPFHQFQYISWSMISCHQMPCHKSWHPVALVSSGN